MMHQHLSKTLFNMGIFGPSKIPYSLTGKAFFSDADGYFFKESFKNLNQNFYSE
jgi:hypothetical protein